MPCSALVQVQILPHPPIFMSEPIAVAPAPAPKPKSSWILPGGRRYNDNPHVCYWRLEPGKPDEFVNWVCFGLMKDRGLPSAVRYVCPISKMMVNGNPLAQEAVTFYLAFMMRIIKIEGAPPFHFMRKKTRIYWWINVKGMRWISALFYLTWFRYPHEFPEMVTELFKRKAEGDTDEILFRKFQEAHNDATNGLIKHTSRYPDSHGLVYNYNGYLATHGREPITIAKLHENIRNGRPTVQDHFR